MLACHISGDSPSKSGSPFYLVNQNETLFERSYRCAPDFLGQPIKPGDLIVSAKHYFGEPYEQLVRGERLEVAFQEVCRFARSGDMESIQQRQYAGMDLTVGMDSPLRLAALNGQAGMVDYLLTVSSERPLNDRARDAFSWACKGGSLNVVLAIEAKCPVRHSVTEDELLLIARQGDQRLFRHLVLATDVRTDTEYLLEMVRNKWAEDAICERIGLTSRQSGALSRRGVKVSL